MKTMRIHDVMLALLGLGLAAASSQGAGLLKSAEGSDAGAFIRDHRVQVTLNNGFARTEVEQVLGNDADQDFEAVYTFPLPRRASLSEVSLWIDGQEVIGEVVERERARKLYEAQVAQGNDTALAEKHDYRTLDISVGRVRAGEDTRVRLVYYQPLEIDLHVGRYVYPLAEGGVDEERIAFWSVDERVSGTFSFQLDLKSAFPIKDVRVPGYDQEARISRGNGDVEGGQDICSVAIHPEGAATLTRDIVVYYRLDDSVPARVELVPYRGSPQEQGTFMVVVTPAADLRPIGEGTDWTFVLDVSGSMRGTKISTLADGVARVIGTLSPNDRYRIVTFNQQAQDVTGGYITATPEHVQATLERVNAIQAGGGTALFAGLKEAYRRLDDDRTSGVILVTDGVANVGPTAHHSFLKLLRTCDIRLFTFVIGTSANRPLLERLAKDSGGFAMNISSSDDIVGRLIQAKAKVLNECLHDVQLRVNGVRVNDLTPATTGNLYLGQQLVAFGHYDEAGEVTVELSAKISGEDRTWFCRATLPAQDHDNPELERLWALSAIEDRMEQIREQGEQDDLCGEIAALGAAYSLVTDYTSMLVLREEAFENEAIQRVNADRVHRERSAQAARASAPVRSYRVDAGQGEGGGAFHGRSAPNIGSGPVGPLFLALLALLTIRKRTS